MQQRKQPDGPAVDMLAFERQVYGQGFQLISGIDEAGRGPLAGPVVAAAVILPRSVSLPGLKDSKLLSPAQREDLYGRICAQALAVGVGCVDAPEIDSINILRATFKAMVAAVGSLTLQPDYLLIDGPYKLPLPIEQRGIPKGDALCLSVAAASVIAKVRRDRLMLAYHEQYPQYGFDSHKGYGARAHLEALRKHGPCPLHRRSFRGVLAVREGEGSDGKPAC